jgi:hypothetical protein
MLGSCRRLGQQDRWITRHLNWCMSPGKQKGVRGSQEGETTEEPAGNEEKRKGSK